MSHAFLPRVGGIVSADIAVPERERELRFYAHVLGTGDAPLWREDLLNNQGMPVIGLGPRTAEYAHLPVQWMPHIQVADVAASAKRAVELGGRELLHGRDDAGQSQWAVLLDPQGAAFGLIPVVAAESLPPVEGAASREGPERVGCIAWLDLTVSDAAATRDFYRQVVGWSVREVVAEDAGQDCVAYEMLGGDGGPAAGVRAARGEQSGRSPVWMIHLPVGDLEESLRRVVESGGEVVEATHGTDGSPGRAVVQDPVGVRLALVPG